MSRDESRLRAKVERAGQSHVFRWWDDLSSGQRDRLLSQIDRIDFERLARVYDEVVRNEMPQPDISAVEPPDAIPIPATGQQRDAAREARAVGEDLLRAGKIATFVVAGGQGTRLGYEAPKGTFPVGPVTGKSLFQFHAEKIAAMGARYGMPLPWYIMTSDTNRGETERFFEEHEFFGLRRNDVFFFVQEMIPAVDEDGKVLLDEKAHVFENPNGHGGSLNALCNSGAVEDMKRRGIEHFFYHQVDNVQIRIADPTFMGYHAAANAEMSSKCAWKNTDYEKVGITVKLDGHLRVVEYTEVTPEIAESRNPDGSYKYGVGNIAIHAFSVDFVERVGSMRDPLPFHVAHKKVPHVNEAGEKAVPETENGYKFETFVFDAFQYAARSIVMLVDRAGEYAPVKSLTGPNAVENARRAMTDTSGSWLEAAGIDVHRGPDGHVQGKIEISPLYALDEQELLDKVDRDMVFEGELSL